MINNLETQLRKLYPVIEVKRAKSRPRHIGCNRYLEDCVCPKVTKAAEPTKTHKVQKKGAK